MQPKKPARSRNRQSIPFDEVAKRLLAALPARVRTPPKKRVELMPSFSVKHRAFVESLREPSIYEHSDTVHPSSTTSPHAVSCACCRSLHHSSGCCRRNSFPDMAGCPGPDGGRCTDTAFNGLVYPLGVSRCRTWQNSGGRRVLATRLPWGVELLHVPHVGLLDTQTVVDAPTPETCRACGAVAGSKYPACLSKSGRQ